ncbi:DUF396 domain protein [Purpureocillium lavendulum]|uniref:DUF396 domain protein n=1 Tax=Purpureocillium lavendulum TaxID=1247861 RepID=A0AB34G247_9HYPO|nr:DUF396 domain protein [Purpureocillium lavendulum]
MSHVPASTTSDGRDVDITSNTTVSLVEYQSLASHGIVAVSDAGEPIAVTYFPGKAVLKAPNSSIKKGKVHVPIHDTPEIISKTYALENVLVYFDVESDAVVDTVTIYYDATKVVATNVNKKNTFHIDFSANEAKKYAYVVTSGICATLDLTLPHSESAINLYSVTLVYKAI